jgi:hypothetical protein
MPTNHAAVAAELVALGDAASDTGSQTGNTRHGGPAAGQEQQQ